MADEDDDMCSLQSDGNSTPRAITPAPPSNEPPEIQVIGVYSRKPGENDLIGLFLAFSNLSLYTIRNIQVKLQPEAGCLIVTSISS